ncbi:adenylate/guanylate cyclase domain-containing protein [Spirochaetia bacterium 38H-sp]|uniref:Adenylate/guanylate cyclase domain-containing protein n=1 Tax=Rarispira pelagica TaxID=3141764 RepID=A0ABU9UBX4_9SPIR
MSKTNTADITDEVVRVSSIISSSKNIKEATIKLVDHSADISGADSAAFYLLDNNRYTLSASAGNKNLPAIFEDTDSLDFLREIQDYIYQSDRENAFLPGLFISESAKSTLAIPLWEKSDIIGILILLSCKENHFKKKDARFISAITKIAGGTIINTRLITKIRDYAREVTELKNYQQSIFSSISNLLITLDRYGNITYINKQTEETLGISKEFIGADFFSIFSDMLSKKVTDKIRENLESGSIIPGIEGILKTQKDSEIDFSLTISPLYIRKNKTDGIVLIFTDQSREKELREKIDIVTEERRKIKDMFSRYLSHEVVQKLIEAPHSIQLGGEKKIATIFFADIRGYTSFSENKSPEYILDILNQYFQHVVEIIIAKRGFIDKFIGDCVMAAWGVPLQSEKQDAIDAVACAIDIQKMIRSPNRPFFKGEAKNLKIGIGIHSGPLVAGNIGSSSYMNYTVIGDTVNIASRIEAISGPDEIIITEETKKLLEDSFKLQKLNPVTVKGKTKPIPVYKVIY